MIGQVTIVASSISSVACATAPSTLHAKAACDWLVSQGW
jgi:hypothetical protein